MNNFHPEAHLLSLALYENENFDNFEYLTSFYSVGRVSAAPARHFWVLGVVLVLSIGRGVKGGFAGQIPTEPQQCKHFDNNSLVKWQWLGFRRRHIDPRPNSPQLGQALGFSHR